jgi:hypothetical protein
MPPVEKQPILVTGAHRTGTTWVGKMLAAGGEAAYISEPLNVLHRPGVFGAPVRYWYLYICVENEAGYLPAFRQTLRLRYHTWAELRSLRSFKDFGRMGRDAGIFLRGRVFRQRPLLKDPFAAFSAPWFAGRLACQVVVTVRHPAAFASSLKRLNWPFDFTDLLSQPLLMRGGLEPFRADMERMAQFPGDIIGQASLLWKLVYRAMSPDFIVVRHEDLSLDPLGGFQALYEKLGLMFNSHAQRSIQASSAVENPGELSQRAVHSVRLDSLANLNNWKRRLEKDEIDRIRQLTEDVAARYYPDLDWGI